MGGGELKFEVHTHEMSREAFFDLKSTKPCYQSKTINAMGSVTKRLNLFPLPGLASVRLQYLFDSPSKSFTKHAILGLGFGLVFGAVWRYWHKQVYTPRITDYYKQLAIANKGEVEKFRLRLVEDAKANPIEQMVKNNTKNSFIH
eukprot:TRINITY_DN40342_c0_g1_i1.p1 TRINITY_DN40342_c0_g1~~TRINITY_DN40342_c0_g1_i1.p1  ORF type:complete len:145 (-),score=7.71 TRINITY_DN40342_c0_g1_i1:65-499(-)